MVRQHGLGGRKGHVGGMRGSGKPVFLVEPHRSILPSDAVQWLRNHPRIQVLNIAGIRESKNPGIGERVERFLTVVFKRVREQAQS